MIKSIAVFCGSRFGNDPKYVQMIEQTAELLVKNNIHIVYGGSHIGLMGALADHALKHQGTVIGIIANCLKNMEFPHPKLTELHYVETLSDRKNMMCEKSDAFLLLPGGLGSLDEFFNMVVLNQVGFINKPSGILNTDGFFDSLIQFLDHAVQTGFIPREHRDALMIETSIEKLIGRMVV